MDTLFLAFWFTAIIFLISILIRNERVYKTRMKANDLIYKKSIHALNNDYYDERKIKLSRAIIEKVTYNKMLYSFLDWDFEKMLDTERKLEEIWK